MEQRVSMVTLGVADLDRSRRFYEDGLGWKRANKEDGIVFFQLPGAVLGLWSAASLAEEVGLGEASTGFGGIALAYNARSREAVDEVLTEAEAAGAPSGIAILRDSAARRLARETQNREEVI